MIGTKFTPESFVPSLRDAHLRALQPDWLTKILNAHRRVAIAGGPRCGKTTLTRTVTDRTRMHGDDYVDRGWSEASERLAADVNGLQFPFIVEGVQVPRALRKGMRVDCVIWLSIPHVPLTKQQEAMAKGCGTVMREWLGDRQMTTVEGAPGVSFIEVT